MCPSIQVEAIIGAWRTRSESILPTTWQVCKISGEAVSSYFMCFDSRYQQPPSRSECCIMPMIVNSFWAKEELGRTAKTSKADRILIFSIIEIIYESYG